MTPRTETTMSKSTSLKTRWDVTLSDYVGALAWAPDGGALAVACSTGAVVVLDGGSGKCLQELPGTEGTLALDWSSDGAWLATGGSDGTLRIWPSGGVAPRVILDAPRGAWVEHVRWAPERPWVASAAGKLLAIHDAEGRVIGELAGHASTLTSVRWSQDGSIVAACCYGGVTVWSPPAPADARLLSWKGSLLALELSPDGEHVACGAQDGAVHVWHTRTGADLEMSGYPVKVRELAWDASSRWLATGGSPEITVWDFSGKGPAGSRPLQLQGHTDLVADLAFHEARAQLASGGRDGRVLVWSLARPKRPSAISAEAAAASKLAFQPRGDGLAAGYESGRVRLFDVPGWGG